MFESLSERKKSIKTFAVLRHCQGRKKENNDQCEKNPGKHCISSIENWACHHREVITGQVTALDSWKVHSHQTFSIEGHVIFEHLAS
jgi:hypothetical protein